MAANTLNILKPSVNDLTARIFMRAAKLEFEERTCGGADEPGAPRRRTRPPDADARGGGVAGGTLGESCAIMQYLYNKRGLEEFYPTDPGKRAMILIGTFYPLLTRATYPTLGFPQYPGEVATSDADDEMKSPGAAGRRAALAEPLDVSPVLPGGQAVHRRRPALDRRHSPLGDARVPERDRLRLPGLGDGVHGRDGGRPSARPTRARGRRARLHRLREALEPGASSRWSARGHGPGHSAASPPRRRRGRRASPARPRRRRGDTLERPAACLGQLGGMMQPGGWGRRGGGRSPRSTSCVSASLID